MKKYRLFFYALAVCINTSAQLSVGGSLAYCIQQSNKTLATLKDYKQLPRSIGHGSADWHLVTYQDWCSGFWPGILWYEYGFSKSEFLKAKADGFTKTLTPLAFSKAYDHDLGFQVFSSFGNGYRFTGNPFYKKVLLAAADTLATLFNPKVGTILSWPRSVPNLEWPQHNTIMDNMINLELLFWASKNGGSQRLYDMAVSHAKKTMQNHFRPDYTSYHVVVYDTLTGKKIKALTHQGYSDSSMWARGQCWAIYGFTMVYRETKDPEFLDFAQKVANVYLQKLPKDLIPFWDFNAPDIPDAPRDASAAAVAASALLELSTFVKDKKQADFYLQKAVQMLTVLSSEKYQGRGANHAFLLHSTGNKPANSEVDASIIYADYYYIEALTRLRRLQNHQTVL